MLPLATTFSTSRAAAEIDRAEGRQLRGGHRHGVVAAASGQRLDAGNRAQREVDGGAAAGEHDLVARPAAAVVAALDDSPATNWPLARLIVSSPLPALILSAPVPPVIVSLPSPASIVSAPLPATIVSAPLLPINVSPVLS